MRNTPEIVFVSDDSIAYGVTMAHRIDEVIRQDRHAEEGEEADFEDDEILEDEAEACEDDVNAETW
jgi:ribosome-binding factor A